jgi:hypothetical protein
MDLDPQTEQTLADMSDADWRALSARVRPPTSSQQLREMAGKVLEPDQLETFMAVANPKAFANEIGDVDEATLTGHLTRLFGASDPQQPQPQPPQQSWGQSTGQPTGKERGDHGRAALEKRHGVGRDSNQPSAGAGIAPGANGRAAAAKRHGGRK